MKCTVPAKDGERAVSFTVKDEGPGMPEDVRARMFEPGFSTKQRGSGVGLAVTRRIVEQHGGAIDVDSAPGTGTSITIRLPAYGSTAQVGSVLTVAPTTVSCAAACDPSTVTGFSLDLRDALCL